MKQYVIAGNGTAAISCIEGIRSMDPEGSITVISAENTAAYCRPMISYLLEGRTDETKMACRSESFYQENNCRVLYGLRAEKLDAEAHQLTLSDGSTLDYDALCIATGSSPFIPPMDGLETVQQRFSFLTLEDARALKAAVSKEKRVLIIGAGLIGLKCAEGLHGLCGHITVCDLADRILSSILDEDGAGVMQRHLEKNGMEFVLSDSVARFEGNTACMKSGKMIPFDILITAVGVRPNISLFTDAGGKAGRAITIDSGMHTSLKDVFAAGDCTESLDVSDGTVRVMALMPNANLQGYTAGVNMAGGSRTFDNAIPMNAIGFFGLHALTAGTRNHAFMEQVTEDSVKKLYMENGRMTGFELIGDVQGAGIYTDLIRNGTDLHETDTENIKKTPALKLYSDEKRRKVLEGVI